jgi:hypothetical protein
MMLGDVWTVDDLGNLEGLVERVVNITADFLHNHEGKKIRAPAFASLVSKVFAKYLGEEYPWLTRKKAGDMVSLDLQQKIIVMILEEELGHVPSNAFVRRGGVEQTSGILHDESKES